MRRTFAALPLFCAAVAWAVFLLPDAAPKLDPKGIADSSDALQAMLDAGGRQHLPAGRYRITRTLTTPPEGADGKWYLFLEGDGGPHPDGQSGTVIVAPPDTTALHVRRLRTGVGDRGKVTGVCFVGAQGEDVSRHGVLVNASRWAFDDCGFHRFAGHGAYATGNTPETPPPANANLTTFFRCFASRNGGGGIRHEGADANVGLCLACDSSGNGGAGFHSKHTFGTNWIACHASVNGVRGYWSEGSSNRSLAAGCYTEGEAVPPGGTAKTNRFSPWSMVVGGQHGLEAREAQEGYPPAVLVSHGFGLRVSGLEVRHLSDHWTRGRNVPPQPSLGPWRRGDWYYHSRPRAGEPSGWIVTEGGQRPKSKPFGWVDE